MAGLCHLRRPASSAVRKLRLGLSPTRSFGAAALQYDYEYDYDYEEEERMRGPSKDRPRLGPRADACGTIPARGLQWVLIGTPGAQKHVCAQRLSKLLEVPHISMGSLVRQELNPRSSLYKKIASAVNEGKLVPEDVIFGLLSERLEERHYRGETGFILDGIPRTRTQAEILDQIVDIDLVVNFKCEECMFGGGGVCSLCGHSFNMGALNPSLHHSHLKPSAVFSKEQDAVKEKLRIYAEESKPLEDYYRKQRKLLDFKVAGAPGETWQGLLHALHLQHMDAGTTSQKLTA
ncbi:probable adenylate kinase 7, mitochondrial [Aristolochia californica]|uniref:probable adenylate kinase 7, mitochondrial n=1 Tax=Aristolochia californica TaxID=171875 RepID=UPI0035DED9D8